MDLEQALSATGTAGATGSQGPRGRPGGILAGPARGRGSEPAHRGTAAGRAAGAVVVGGGDGADSREAGAERRLLTRLLAEIGEHKKVLVSRRAAVRDLTAARNAAMLQAVLGGVRIPTVASLTGMQAAQARALVEVLDDPAWFAGTQEDHVARLRLLVGRLGDMVAARDDEEQCVGELVVRAHALGLKEPAYLASVSGLPLNAVRQRIRQGCSVPVR